MKALLPGKLTSKLCQYFCWALLFVLFLTPHLKTEYFVDNYTIIKWSSVYLASVLAVLVIFFGEGFTLIGGKLLWIAAALVAGRLISIGANFNAVTLQNGFDCLICGVFVIAFMTGLQKKIFNFENLFWLFIVSSLVVVLRSVFDLVQCRILLANPDPVCFSTSFGNINMISEYILIFTPLAIYYLRSMKGFKSHLAGWVYGLFLYIMLAGYSRSAWLGMIILAVCGLIRGLSRKELIYSLLALAAFSVTSGFKTEGFDYSRAKEGSFNKRIQLFYGSLDMLADSPLGVGGGEYEYGYIPYQMATNEKPSELEIYRTPHDEFMKWGIEGGWFFLIAVVAWWLVLLILAWKTSMPAELKYFSMASLLTLGPQMGAQFPFDNAASFFGISFVLALILSQLEIKTMSFGKVWKIPLGLLALLCLINAVTYSVSHYTDSNQGNVLDSVVVGCQLYPANWRACNSQGVIQVLSENYFNDALPVITAELRRRPFQYVALRLFALNRIKNGDMLHGCQIGRVYDSLFFGKSLWTQYLATTCPSVPSPLKFENGPQFKRDYLQWLLPQLDAAIK